MAKAPEFAALWHVGMPMPQFYPSEKEALADMGRLMLANPGRTLYLLRTMQVGSGVGYSAEAAPAAQPRASSPPRQATEAPKKPVSVRAFSELRGIVDTPRLPQLPTALQDEADRLLDDAIANDCAPSHAMKPTSTYDPAYDPREKDDY